MKTNHLIIASLILILGVGIYAIGVLKGGLEDLQPSTINLQGQVSREGFNIAGTNSSTSVSTAGTSVLAENQERVYARISNNSGNDIWCAVATTSAIDEGLALYGSSTLEFGEYHIPATGPIHCTAEVATSSVGVIEN